MIFFGYDAKAESVVIGPQLLNRRRRRGRSVSTVPELLEKGGDAVTDDGKPAHYSAFPYMGPALDKERDKLGDLFADSVK
jgi:hypothetical protein